MFKLSVLFMRLKVDASFFLSGLDCRILLLSFLAIFLTVFTGNVHAGQITLTWDANTEPHLSGYKIHYGQASRNYDHQIDVGNQTTYSLATPSGDQTTYFAVTAYDSNGQESDFSKEVSWTPSQTQTGSLSVAITPAEAEADGARWRVSGGAWKKSGQTVSGLITGTHTVEFSSISGWSRPANQSVSITHGKFTTSTGNYQKQNNSTLVTLTWDANTEPHLSGYRIHYGQVSRNYDHQIDVGNQTSYSMPPPSGDKTTYFAVTAYDSNGQESDFSQEVSWTPGQTQNGSLSVAITPAEAKTDGARWRVDGGAWKESGQTVSGLISGTHTVEFSSISGWSRPADQSVSVTDNALTTLVGEYTTFIADVPFIVSQSAGEAPLHVTFTVSPPTNPYASYNWFFGEGQTASGESVTHTYASPGTYVATLSIFDVNRTLNEHSVTITVNAADHANEPPTAIISASRKRGAPPLLVKFSGAGSRAAGEREIVSYQWNFGDGISATGRETSHTFELEAEYEIALKVTDNFGNTDTASMTIRADSYLSHILPILIHLLLED